MRRPLPGVWYFGLVGFADAPALFTEVDAVFAHGVCIPPIYGLFPPCACSPNWGGFEVRLRVYCESWCVCTCVCLCVYVCVFVCGCVLGHTSRGD